MDRRSMPRARRPRPTTMTACTESHETPASKAAAGNTNRLPTRLEIGLHPVHERRMHGLGSARVGAPVVDERYQNEGFTGRRGHIARHSADAVQVPRLQA